VFFGKRNGLAGIALEIVDGGEMDGIIISNIRINETIAPIFLRLGNRARPHTSGIPKPGIGSMKNIQISNILATNTGTNGCAISGIPGHNIENVTLSNISIQVKGEGKADHKAGSVPEVEAEYPESNMFGTLPAYGFYTRHVNNIHFDNIQLSFNKKEERPAMVFEEVNDLVLRGVYVDSSEEVNHSVLIKNVSDYTKSDGNIRIGVLSNE
jgi:hypothetical protein